VAGTGPRRKSPGGGPGDVALLGRSAWRGSGPGVRESRLTVSAVSGGGIRVDSRTGDEQQLLIVHPDGRALAVDRDGVADIETGGCFGAAWIRLGLVGPMLAPAALAGVCRLTEPGMAGVAGQDCLTTRAALRPQLLGQLPQLFGYGVRCAELAVDRATGLVLKVTAVDDADRSLHAVEVERLDPNPVLDPDLFALRPTSGSTPRAPEQGGPVTLREAAALAPFRAPGHAPAARRSPHRTRGRRAGGGMVPGRQDGGHRERRPHRAAVGSGHPPATRQPPHRPHRLGQRAVLAPGRQDAGDRRG
jgi:hypothetical protein